MAVTGHTFHEQVRFSGNGLAWDDWMFPAVIVNLPAIADPRFGKWLDDGAGSAGVWGWFFDNGEVAPLVAQQLPHRAALGGANMIGHLHWRFVSAPTVGAPVIWDVEYTIAGRMAQHAATTSHLTGTYVTTAADLARTHATLNLSPTVSMSGLTVSSLCDVTVKRTGGTYGDEVFLGGFDFHYQQDALGSDQATTKAV